MFLHSYLADDLWEKFVLSSIKRNKDDDIKVKVNFQKRFWQSYKGSKSSMKPDIVITKDDETIVLDTKWKNLNGKNPSPDDLRQMFVYSKYFNAKKVALLYPDKDSFSKKGIYYDELGNASDKECAIIGLAVNKHIKQWQKDISNQINNWSQ